MASTTADEKLETALGLIVEAREQDKRELVELEERFDRLREHAAAESTKPQAPPEELLALKETIEAQALLLAKRSEELSEAKAINKAAVSVALEKIKAELHDPGASTLHALERILLDVFKAE